ncbi:MAG: hypothetical protein IJ137_01940, partial [Eubacterium sp.]|nr:hypothetical protein [Eubacterium sp.]
RQQDVNYRISRDNDSYAKKIELLRVREIELNNQQRKLAQDLDEYTNKVSVEEGWLKSLDADQYMKEVQLLTQRYEKIIKLREKLEKDWGSLWTLDRFGDYSGRDHIAQVLRQNLSDIGSDLQRYRQDLMEVIELLSSEEVLL